MHPCFTRTIVFAALLTFSWSVAAQEGPVVAPGVWQHTYQLNRDDQRIRTKGGADLLRVQVIHSRGDDTADVYWVAGRAVCADVAAPPCEWVGATGTSRARILGGDLVFALPLSAQAENPMIVILRHRVPVAKGKPSAPGQGQIMNALGDFAYRFTWTTEDQ